MKMKQSILGKISLGVGLVVVMTVAAWLSGATGAAQSMKDPHGMMQMQHITTQAQAEALKPGDSMSMTCSTCKNVMVRTVTTDKSHVKMMTAGEKDMCDVCGGTVTVVATGKGKGKDAEVKHVCSKCGDDKMFCSATKPGGGSMKGMK